MANPTVTVVIKNKSFTAFGTARTIDSLESERDRHFVGIPGPVKFSTTAVTVIKKISTIESLIREHGKLTKQVFIRRNGIHQREWNRLWRPAGPARREEIQPIQPLQPMQPQKPAQPEQPAQPIQPQQPMQSEEVRQQPSPSRSSERSPARQAPNQSVSEGAAPFLVSKEISDDLTVWLTKGMSGEESKAI